MMNRRQRRALFRQLESQMEQERNGAPIPREIAAKLTPERDEQPLFQVWVERRNGQPPIAFGPKMIRDACEMFAAAIRQQIDMGKEKLIANPIVVPA